MIALQCLGRDAAEISDWLNVHKRTVTRWMEGSTSPSAYDIYRICVVLRLKPMTFAPHSPQAIYRVDEGKMMGGVWDMGRWVHARMREVRQANYRSVTKMALDSDIHYTTVKRCLEVDNVAWPTLMNFMSAGLEMDPFDLLNPAFSVATENHKLTDNAE